MFISQKFHSGIEPLFYVDFPHKTLLFWFLVNYLRRLCLICISGTPPLFLFFHLRRSLSTCHDAPRDVNYKRGSYLRFNVSFLFFQTHISMSKTTLATSTLWNHKRPFLRGNTSFYHFKPLRPIHTHGSTTLFEMTTFYSQNSYF